MFPSFVGMIIKGYTVMKQNVGRSIAFMDVSMKEWNSRI